MNMKQNSVSIIYDTAVVIFVPVAITAAVVTIVRTAVITVLQKFSQLNVLLLDDMSLIYGYVLLP